MSLPPLYARWIETLLGESPADEPQATCSSCTMCVRDGVLPASSAVFVPQVKCCQYLPELPNFLVGGILADGDPAGVASVRRRIAAGAGVTPLGLSVSSVDDARWRQGTSAFGQRVDLVCPHYVGATGTCSIWQHRNAVCATWFCKHERGAAGHAAWMAVKELIAGCEATLAVWASLRLDVEPGVLRRLLGSTTERGTIPEDEASRAAWWGSWHGREEELYLQAWKLVSGLSWDQVKALSGPPIEARERFAVAAAEQLRPAPIPAALRTGAFRMLAVGADDSLAITYSPYDPVRLPAALMTVLHYFDGRPTEAAYRAMADERGIVLDDALVRQLVDFGVLLAS
jgi:hypothetical protein